MKRPAMGIIYISEDRAAAAILCCLFGLALGWQVWSWGNTQKKYKPRKP